MTYAGWAAWIIVATVFNTGCAILAAWSGRRGWQLFLVTWATILAAAAVFCLYKVITDPNAVPPIQ